MPKWNKPCLYSFASRNEVVLLHLGPTLLARKAVYYDLRGRENFSLMRSH